MPANPAGGSGGSSPRASRGRRPSLRIRVLAGVLLVTVVVLCAFDLAAVTGLRRYLYNQTDTQLANVLALYKPFHITAVRPPGAGKPRFQKVSSNFIGQTKIRGPHLFVHPPLFEQYFVVYFLGSKPRGVVGGNQDLQPVFSKKLAQDRHPETVTGANGRDQLRLRTARLGGGTLVVTTSLAGVHKTLDRLELILVIGSACALLAAGAGGALVLRRGMRPIESMASQADRITAGDLTERVDGHAAGTEVARLGAALNGMLARIEASVREREASQELTRRFFADASHELRTPLASLRANAELYTQGALTERQQVDEAMRRIAAESQRMSVLVDDMLRLARLDQHPGQDTELVDVTELVTECVEQVKATDPNRTWTAVIDDGLEATGDEELLRRAITNLLINVRTHTPDGTAAMVTASRVNGSVTVDVTDDGPGVPDNQLPRIFDRFYRAAPSPRPGAGLGLAIVAAIAAAHDGAAQAEPVTPHGLRITLTLPAAP
ncbi:MAG TPA: HAMP domain-containing sensor histidine kinase [Streptosporangiaceae bacterium]|nr:HAMP domain-containing sensor histidine kinase [Streptosporangiaceae bacterium]